MITITADLEACQAMRPEIEPGDVLHIEKGIPITAEDITLISIDNVQMLGRVKLISCGVWVSFSNPAYDAIFIPVEELNRLRIMGKVTKKKRSYK